jgi:two-component system sensor histidine kinase PhoQ
LSTSSLRTRLLVSATFTLVAFLGLAGIALDKSFVSSAKLTVKNQLKTQVNALLTVMEIDQRGNLVMPERMPEPRLSSPNSGLYAVIIDNYGNVLWRSNSSLGLRLDSLVIAKPGSEIFVQVGGKLNSPFYYSFGVNWELDVNRSIHLSLVMLNESRSYRQTIRSYRKELIFWLGMAGFLLLAMQAISLRWGLRPLGQVIRELDLIERSRQKKIMGDYPQEIAQLSRRINLFIESERRNLQRYRDTLGDLAHSLKTPLAVIKGMSDSNNQSLEKADIDELVDRMNKIVEYQLKRAASAQVSIMHSAVSVESVLVKLNSSLQKVYADKHIEVGWHIEDDSVFYGDEGDLFELLGNVMDNAYKWSQSRVAYYVMIHKATSSIHSGLTIEIHDDGPGIAPEARDEVLKRGARADEQTPGQGIGLAVVREIIQRYDGELEIEKSEFGGTLIRAGFPPT